MTEQWDGRPQNPERDGWHWVQYCVELPEPHEWLGSEGTHPDFGGTWNAIPGPPERAAQGGYRYLGPCLTPAEVAALTAQRDDWVEQARKAMDDAEAREAAARREGIEALAVQFERLTDHATAALVRAAGAALLEDAPRAVADLKPTIRALDTARVAAARREGIEAAAKKIDCDCDNRDEVLARLEARDCTRASWLCRHGDVCCALQAAEIRTLKWEGGL